MDKIIDVNEQIDKFVLENREKEKGEHGNVKDNEYYMSWAGKCPRQIYIMKKHGFEAGPELLRIFMTGNLWHDFLREKVLGLGKEKRIQVKYRDIILRGRTDGDDEINKVRYEFKSIFKLPEEANEHHVKQLMLYLDEEYKIGSLVYVEKNRGTIKQFAVKYSKEAFDEAAKSLIETNEYVKNNKIPPKITEKKDKWQCRYCFKECKNKCKELE